MFYHEKSVNKFVSVIRSRDGREVAGPNREIGIEAPREVRVVRAELLPPLIDQPQRAAGSRIPQA